MTNTASDIIFIYVQDLEDAKRNFVYSWDLI